MTHFLNFELQAVQSKTLVLRTDFLMFLKIKLLILVYLKKVCLKHRICSTIQHQFCVNSNFDTQLVHIVQFLCTWRVSHTYGFRYVRTYQTATHSQGP